MTASLYRVVWRDGSTKENLSNAEAMLLLEKHPQQWAAVQPMAYGKDLDPANARRRKAWGM